MAGQPENLIAGKFYSDGPPQFVRRTTSKENNLILQDIRSMVNFTSVTVLFSYTSSACRLKPAVEKGLDPLRLCLIRNLYICNAMS